MRTVDVAIVGGGVVGWSCAWHLLRREPKLSVAVFDPKPDRSAALRGTGGARAQFGSRVNIEMSLASIEELKGFREATGHDIGFRQVGYLLFTASDPCASIMEQAVILQKECGVPVRELDRAGIASLAPFLRIDDLVYGAISYSDGLLSAPDVVQGFRDAAIRLGAVDVRSSVTRIDSGGLIQTDQETVAAREVVITAGQWSGTLGFDLPVRPECHQLYIRPEAAGIPDDAPMLVDCDTTFHFRRRGAGLAVGYHDSILAESKCRLEDQPAFRPEAFERMAAASKERCPEVFDGWNQPEGWAGCYSATPDGQAILGRHDGLIIATGFGGHGVMHSPASGQLVTELILDGRTTLDISALAPSRFGTARATPRAETMVF